MSSFKPSDRIIRVEHEKNFTQIVNSTLRDTRLSWKARGLHHYLLSLSNNWDVCIAHLVEQSKQDGMASVKSALKELESMGYMHKERLKDEHGRFTKCLWYVYEVPQVENRLVDETASGKASSPSPQVDFPPVEKPPVEKPPVENRALRNTYKRNTDLKKNDQKKKEKEILEPLSFFPSGRDQESEAQNNISSHAQTKNPNIQDPQTPKPLSPAAPENIGKPVHRKDRPEAQTKEREAFIAPLLKDHDFLKYLFREMKRLKTYFQPFSDTDYESHAKLFMEIGCEPTTKGDRRFREIQDFAAAYDRHKAEQSKIEEERLQREQEHQARQEPSPEWTPEKRKQIVADLKRKKALRDIGVVVDQK